MHAEQARILIVDDDPSTLRTTAMILERKGYGVDTAENGLEAVNMVAERDYDVVLMDIKMPKMNGVEAHRRIKAIRPETTVVMITAYAVETLIQQALDDGAYGILYKPLDIDKMIAIIEEARANRESALIMVVDDDPKTCKTMRKILAGRGYRVLTALTGEDAIAIAEENDCDIIFVDMKLPTINGLETYLAIRESNPETVAIMMTAYRHEMDELIDLAMKKNASACFYKPLDMDALLAYVEKVCE
jgi:DNA-binding NtrC family response regulator